RIAQTVSVGATGTLLGVRFQSLSPVPPATSCPLTVSIEGVNPASGAPDDNQLFASASATVFGQNQIIPLPSLFFGVDSRIALVLSSTGSCQTINSSLFDSYQAGAA